MTLPQRMDAETYEWLAADPRHKLTELHGGIPTEKPVTSEATGDLLVELAVLLRPRLDDATHRLRVNHAKLAVPGVTFFIPAVAVMPKGRSEAGSVKGDVYHDPASLVIEIWAPTRPGHHDVVLKIPGYMVRGDREIWLLHPLDRTVTRWVRRDDGEYECTVLTGGLVTPVDLPDLTIDLDALLR